MDSCTRVRRTILGQATDRQPIYGWVSANLTEEITAKWGSVAAFEDRYKFDAAHIFGGPGPFDHDKIAAIKAKAEAADGEFTPEWLLDADIFTDPNDPAAYEDLIANIRFHKARQRFCYVQTPGFFEPFNDVFGIENQLLWMAMYPDALDVLYGRLEKWTLQFAAHCAQYGADMIHISDDWGSQKALLFSPALWKKIIYPHMKALIDHAHALGVFASLHSDGCVLPVADGIAALGFDVVHPWQENAGMSYDVYLDHYADRFAILGGVCVQSALGILPRPKLESEIRRVFGLLRGKRWICCTTHFVQNHCTVEDLEFAYDLIYRLARE